MKSASGGASDHLLGLAAMAGTGFAWSLGGLFIKVLDWNPWAIAGGRSLIAAVLLLLVFRKLRFSFSPAQIAGALSYGVCMILFVFANKLTTAANAILLQYTGPIFTAFLGVWILKESVRWYHWGALMLTGVGLWLLVSPGGGGHWVGDLLALASGLAFSLTFIFGRKEKSGAAGSLILAHGFTALVGISLSFTMTAPSFKAESLGALFVLGLVQLGLASVLFNYGLKRVSALTANLTSVVEPVLNPLWVFLILGERPGSLALLGGSLILLGVTGASVLPLLVSRSRNYPQKPGPGGSPAAESEARL